MAVKLEYRSLGIRKRLEQRSKKTERRRHSHRLPIYKYKNSGSKEFLESIGVTSENL